MSDPKQPHLNYCWGQISREQISRFVVTAEQMRQIEGRVFAAGMPVEALMEKVGGLLAQRIMHRYPLNQWLQVGILVGPGHNGGDALVIARELHFHGYQVVLYQPLPKSKPLPQQHAQYAASLGIPFQTEVESLQGCDVLIDGLFGFGLEREISGDIAADIDQLNQWQRPVVSIDLPSGIHTDTGEILGTALQAAHTYCLGLWKRAFLQDAALEYTGTVELVDFDLPLADIHAVLGNSPVLQRLTRDFVLSTLPLDRPPTAHKYQMGHVLLVCGSQRYMGAAILTGLGARASGVGMVTLAVPENLKPIAVAQLPEALVVVCPEDRDGSISTLSDAINLEKYDVIACGPGLTPAAQSVVESVLASSVPLLLDADGLNILANLDPAKVLASRNAPTVLTPHPGEFKRLFPTIAASSLDRIARVQAAANQSGAIILLKGAKVAVAMPYGPTWLNPDSTAALARGGSGDVLTGLLGGLMAQAGLVPHGSGTLLESLGALTASAAWWHAQAGLLAAQDRTSMGVDAFTLSQYLPVAAREQTALGL